MSQPLFSVITPTCYREYLFDVVQLLAAQECQDFEWIIVGDGLPPNGFIDRLKGWIDKHWENASCESDGCIDFYLWAHRPPNPKILITWTEEATKCYGNQQRDLAIMRAAIGEFIVFCDDDDTPLPWWLRTYDVCHGHIAGITTNHVMIQGGRVLGSIMKRAHMGGQNLCVRTELAKMAKWEQPGGCKRASDWHYWEKIRDIAAEREMPVMLSQLGGLVGMISVAGSVQDEEGELVATKM